MDRPDSGQDASASSSSVVCAMHTLDIAGRRSGMVCEVHTFEKVYGRWPANRKLNQWKPGTSLNSGGQIYAGCKGLASFVTLAPRHRLLPGTLSLRVNTHPFRNAVRRTRRGKEIGRQRSEYSRAADQSRWSVRHFRLRDSGIRGWLIRVGPTFGERS